MSGRWSRRRFLGAATATVCVGCSDDIDVTGVTRHPDEVALDIRRARDELEQRTDDAVGFGIAVFAGPLDEVLDSIESEGTHDVGAARSWLVRVPDEFLADAIDTYDSRLHEGLSMGLLALFQKCPHLGCRVPHCSASGWFECSSHRSMYGGTGEHRSGPGPRGPDLLPVRLSDDSVLIDTGVVIEGLPIGTVIVDRPPRGPHCVSGNEH